MYYVYFNFFCFKIESKEILLVDVKFKSEDRLKSQDSRMIESYQPLI